MKEKAKQKKTASQSITESFAAWLKYENEDSAKIFVSKRIA
jgi:hypothetical protein